MKSFPLFALCFSLAVTASAADIAKDPTPDEIQNIIKGVKPNRDEPELRLPLPPRVSVPLAPRPADPELA